MVLSPLNLVGTETTESLSWAAAAACAIGAAHIRMGRGGGVGRLGGVKPFGRVKGLLVLLG